MVRTLDAPFKVAADLQAGKRFNNDFNKMMDWLDKFSQLASAASKHQATIEKGGPFNKVSMAEVVRWLRNSQNIQAWKLQNVLIDDDGAFSKSGGPAGWATGADASWAYLPYPAREFEVAHW